MRSFGTTIALNDQVTPGQKPEELLEQEWEEMGLPPLGGKSVLDIGAWDGYFSFRAEVKVRQES